MAISDIVCVVLWLFVLVGSIALHIKYVSGSNVDSMRS